MTRFKIHSLRDVKKRKLFRKREQKRIVLKYLQQELSYTKLNNLKKKISYQIFKLKNFSITLIRRRCIVSGDARSVYKKFKLSRKMLKVFCYKGWMPLYKWSR